MSKPENFIGSSIPPLAVAARYFRDTHSCLVFVHASLFFNEESLGDSHIVTAEVTQHITTTLGGQGFDSVKNCMEDMLTFTSSFIYIIDQQSSNQMRTESTPTEVSRFKML